MRNWEEMQTLGSHQSMWAASLPVVQGGGGPGAQSLEWVFQELLQDIWWVGRWLPYLEPIWDQQKGMSLSSSLKMREADERSFHLAFSSVLGAAWCRTCARPSLSNRLFAATYFHIHLMEDWLGNWESVTGFENIWHSARLSVNGSYYLGTELVPKIGEKMGLTSIQCSLHLLCARSILLGAGL